MAHHILFLSSPSIQSEGSDIWEIPEPSIPDDMPYRAHLPIDKYAVGYIAWPYSYNAMNIPDCKTWGLKGPNPSSAECSLLAARYSGVMDIGVSLGSRSMSRIQRTSKATSLRRGAKGCRNFPRSRCLETMGIQVCVVPKYLIAILRHSLTSPMRLSTYLGIAVSALMISIWDVWNILASRKKTAGNFGASSEGVGDQPSSDGLGRSWTPIS